MATNARPGWAQANGEPVALAGYVQNTWDMSEPESPRRLDQILQGQSITTYTHQKSGMVHALAGPAGARYIRWDMTATAEYGDSWTLNGEPVVVVYCDGNPILPHWLVAGDLLLGIVSAGKITLTIPTPKPNENLLDNWYFADPINQRGQTEYTVNNTAIYTIDRWQFLNYGKVSINIAGLVITGYTDNTELHYCNFGQTVDPSVFRSLQGKTITVSVLGSGIFGLFLEIDGTYPVASYHTDNTMSVTSFTYTLPSEIDSMLITVQNTNTSEADVNITALKLELGPAQTLARQDADGSWVLLDPPPNKATELLKCQRYYQKLYGRAVGHGSFFFVPIPAPMRAVPVIESIDAKGSCYYGDGTQKAVTGVEIDTSTSVAEQNGLNFIVTRDSEDAGTGDWSDFKLAVSADL